MHQRKNTNKIGEIFIVIFCVNFLYLFVPRNPAISGGENFSIGINYMNKMKYGHLIKNEFQHEGYRIDVEGYNDIFIRREKFTLLK